MKTLLWTVTAALALLWSLGAWLVVQFFDLLLGIGVWIVWGLGLLFLLALALGGQFWLSRSTATRAA